LRRDLRAGTAQMIVLLLVGLVLLTGLYKFGSGFADGTLAVVIREVLLMILAIGFVRILISFIFQTLLRKADVPRILADVLFVLVLVVYALYRMHVAGVNLASIVASGTVLAGGIALSLRDTIGNLWGGIAVQLDNTCRIGDWVRIENVIGQIVDIRWRYLAVATNSGETKPELNGLFGWKNAEDTFGVIVQGFYEQRSVRRYGQETLGYTQISSSMPIAAANPSLVGVWAPSLIGSALFEQEKTREGVDGAIHAAAGAELLAECETLGGAETGHAKRTRGYRLPARFVIHAVGPIWQGGSHGEDELLASAYRESLKLASDLRSVAFPAISTGVYGFPKERATRIAVREVKRFLAAGGHSLERVVFCCFSAADEAIYRRVLAEG